MIADPDENPFHTGGGAGSSSSSSSSIAAPTSLHSSETLRIPGQAASSSSSSSYSSKTKTSTSASTSNKYSSRYSTGRGRDREREEYDDDRVKADVHLDHSQMTQWWINERLAPEILPYQQELVDGLTHLLVSLLENFEAIDDEDLTDSAVFSHVIKQQEVERIKHVIRSYLRTRMMKIERQAVFILATPEYKACLSTEELKFAEGFAKAVAVFYTRTILDTLPHRYQALSDFNMIIRPDVDNAVFCRVNENIGQFQADDNTESVNMSKDNIVLLKYSSIKPLLMERKVDLI
ncbi:GINS complex subunit [Blyttiomyces sp. JEL0837]|nr:GINS complex subunit [Blyttiomyces sp. JEL0837]